MAARVEPFESVSIILPIINETHSLVTTVDVIEQMCDSKDIKEYIAVVCGRTTKDSLETCKVLQERFGAKFRLHHQKLPFIGGAMREAFDLAEGSHTIMMSTDLETDPHVVRNFIVEAKRHPSSIITASRWIKGGEFHGYNPVKLAANYAFQKIFALLYSSKLTDLTYAYRIFPTSLLQSIAWEELKHPFFLETVIKPLRLGVNVIEIPAVWKARTEGESQNPFLNNFVYFRIALKVKFYPRERILQKHA
ncbi:MAG: glycosyltransferase family 2 protein [Bdellovibrionota bacterium]